MSNRNIQVITLLSDSDESPNSPFTDDVQAISIKQEPIKLKESARKSINKKSDLSTNQPINASRNSNLTGKTQLSQNASSKQSNLSQFFEKKPSSNINSSATLSKTARKSMYPTLSQKVGTHGENKKTSAVNLVKSLPTVKTIASEIKNKNTHSNKKNESLLDSSTLENLKNRGIVITNGSSEKHSSKLVNNNIPTVTNQSISEQGSNYDKTLNQENHIHLLTNKSSSNSNLSLISEKATHKKESEPNKILKAVHKNESVIESMKSAHKNESVVIESIKSAYKIVSDPNKNLKMVQRNEDDGRNSSTSSKSNKKRPRSLKFDKDVSLSWSKKKKISSELDNQPNNKVTLNTIPSNGSEKGNALSCANVSATNKTIKSLSKSISNRSVNESNKPQPISDIIIELSEDGVGHFPEILKDDSSGRNIKSNSLYSSSSATSRTSNATALNNLPTELPAHEKVREYLMKGVISDVASESEEIGRQTKQVTSPKLSLKRKNISEIDVPNATKKGLFSHEKSNDESSLPNIENFSTHIKTKVPEVSMADQEYTLTKNTSSVHSRSSSVIKPSTLTGNDVSGPSSGTPSMESNRQKFNLLIDYCLTFQIWSPEERSNLKMKMLEKLNGASESYISSLEFSSLIDSTWQSIAKDSNKICTILINFKAELKARKASKKSHKRIEAKKIEPSTSSVRNLEYKTSAADSKQCNGVENSINLQSTKLNIPEKVDSPPKNSTTQLSHPLSISPTKTISLDLRPNVNVESNVVPFSSTLNEASRRVEEKRLRRIKKYEDFLKELDEKIKKMQTRELSLDDLDDEDSAYLLEEKYKKKFVKIYAILCKLQNCSSRLGSAIEKRFRFAGTRYIEINKAVENFMNKRKKFDKFPSFSDIFDLIKNVNEAVVLGLREKEYKTLAEEVFKEVGAELKKRRNIDEQHCFGCYLTDNIDPGEDPAEKDEELKRKLETSVIEGEKKLDEIIAKYVTMEETPGSREGTESDDDDESVNSFGARDDEDHNLPSTEPATPEEDMKEPTFPSNPVFTVPSDSDASTDPGFQVSKPDELLPGQKDKYLLTGFNLAPITPLIKKEAVDVPPPSSSRHRENSLIVGDAVSDSDASNVSKSMLENLKKNVVPPPPSYCDLENNLTVIDISDSSASNDSKSILVDVPPGCKASKSVLEKPNLLKDELPHTSHSKLQPARGVDSDSSLPSL